MRAQTYHESWGIGVDIWVSMGLMFDVLRLGALATGLPCWTE